MEVAGQLLNVLHTNPAPAWLRKEHAFGKSYVQRLQALGLHYKPQMSLQVGLASHIVVSE